MTTFRLSLVAVQGHTLQKWSTCGAQHRSQYHAYSHASQGFMHVGPRESPDKPRRCGSLHIEFHGHLSGHNRGGHQGLRGLVLVFSLCLWVSWV